MKIRIAWILLAIYLNASTQTLLPFVQDCFAHMFLWQDHLEHVHHGQVHSHHVHDEVAAANHDGDSKNLPATPSNCFNDKVLSAHLPIISLLKPTPATNFDRQYIFWAFIWQRMFKEVITPPPDLG